MSWNTVVNIDENNYVSYLDPGKFAFQNTSFGTDNEAGETALVTRNPWRCLILNGNFLKEYEELVDQGYEACYNFFLSKKDEHASSWSDS